MLALLYSDREEKEQGELMPRYIFSIVLSALMLACVAMPERAHADIRVYGHRVPPFSIHDGQGGVHGFSAELFHMVFDGMDEFGITPVITPVTFNRLYTGLQRAERRVGITVGRNAKREGLFKWVGPYLEISLGVIAKKSRRFKINTVADFMGYKIATVENTAPEQVLLKLGVAMDSLNRDLYPKRNVLKLESDRVDFFAYPLAGAAFLMAQHGVDPTEYEEVFPLRRIKLYFAFSKDFDDTQIVRYQRRLDEVLKTDAFQVLKAKYSLDAIQGYNP